MTDRISTGLPHGSADRITRPFARFLKIEAISDKPEERFRNRFLRWSGWKCCFTHGWDSQSCPSLPWPMPESRSPQPTCASRSLSGDSRRSGPGQAGWRPRLQLARGEARPGRQGGSSDLAIPDCRRLPDRHRFHHVAVHRGPCIRPGNAQCCQARGSCRLRRFRSGRYFGAALADAVEEGVTRCSVNCSQAGSNVDHGLERPPPWSSCTCVGHTTNQASSHFCPTSGHEKPSEYRMGLLAKILITDSYYF